VRRYRERGDPEQRRHRHQPSQLRHFGDVFVLASRPRRRTPRRRPIRRATASARSSRPRWRTNITTAAIAGQIVDAHDVWVWRRLTPPTARLDHTTTQAVANAGIVDATTLVPAVALAAAFNVTTAALTLGSCGLVEQPQLTRSSS